MFLRLTSDEPRTRPYQAGKTRQHPVTVHLIRPDELGPAEIATWHSMQGATPPLADPFLSPEFARAVGRVQPDTHVAVLAERETITGFFPFERRQFGVGVPIGGWLSLSQGLIHAEGASWDNYTIRVVSNSQTKEQTISLKSGESRELTFDFGAATSHGDTGDDYH